MRDVAVNVAANLVAAAAVWLVIQGTGLVTANPVLTLRAIGILLLAITVPLTAVSQRMIWATKASGLSTRRRVVLGHSALVAAIACGVLAVVINIFTGLATSAASQLADFVKQLVR